MEMIIAGPIGGPVSNIDSRWDEKGKTMVSHIFVSYDRYYITSIQFGYNVKGALVMSAKHGSSFGHNFRVVKLNPNEFVTGLSGVITTGSGMNSLTFYTNLGKHGPICEPTLPVNCYPEPILQQIDLALCDRPEFGGFFGSCSAGYLKSIGIYMSPIPKSVVKSENV
ncbi:hypothetical protein N665_0636s0024 [Sinapis alba]|nr:hypothetical protein N665_0636s0024 [Sinapis alba]